MTELLFDTPWWLPALIATVGIVVFVAGNKRVENRVRLAGAAIVLLAIALAAVSYLVDTPLETAEKRSRELVDAFERSDFATMSSILHPGTIVTVLSAPVYDNRDQIIAAAKDAQERYRFKSVNVLSTDAKQTQSLITITMVVLSQQDALATTLNSEWQFEWQKSAEGWSLVEIRALKIGQSTGDQVRGMFPGRR